MRLHSLRFAGIGPFRESQEINFDQLAASGLFLIDGPTGAGKTTVIDAIVFALYGDVSGRDAADSRLRSDFCAPGEPSFVECEFSVGDRRVSLRRTPKFERLKARGGGTTTAPASQTLSEMDGTGVVRAELTQASEIGAHISNLLGMSAQQFRQLVVLPQGEFAGLLRMKPAERFSALGPLLGDEFFRRLQLDLEKAGSDARGERVVASEAVRSAGDALRGALGDLDFDAVRTELEVVIDSNGSERGAAAQTILSWLTQRSVALANELAERQAAADAAREELARVDSYLAARTAVDQAQSERAGAIERLDHQDQGVDSAQARERISQLDQSRGSLKQWVLWEREDQAREAEQRQAVAEVQTLSAAVEQLSSSLSSLPVERQRQEQTLNAVAALAGASEQLLKNLEALGRNAEQAQELILLETAIAKAASAVRQTAVVASKASGAVDEATLRLDEMLDNFSQGRAAALAGALVEGQPCPVCGAIDHPHPAAAIHELVTDGEIEELRSELKIRAEAAKQAQDALKQAESEVAMLELDASRMRGALDEIDVGLLPKALDQAQQAVADAADAVAQLPGLREALELLATRETTLAEEMRIASNALTAQRTSLELLQAQSARQNAELAEIVGESGSAELLTSHLTTRITLLEAFIAAEQNVALATSTLPTLAEVQDVDAWVAQTQRQAAETAENLEAQQQASGELRFVAEAARRPVKEFQDALNELERITAQSASVIALGDAVSAARGGINVRHMTLQSYAVQRRFESVLSAASIHLARMSAGKYTLELDDEARGNAQAGLGIKVRDEWTGQARDPRSLSGGETFYAALALALGLADVVRDEAGGSQLETLFVDEGFGSLDQDSLQLVLDQLDLLRSGGRIVGVVSHVTEMKEWVQQRVEVSVGPDRTSRLRTLP